MMWPAFHEDRAAVSSCRPQRVVGPQTPAEQFTLGRNAAGVRTTGAEFPEDGADGNCRWLRLGAFTRGAHLTPFVASPAIGTAAIGEGTHVPNARNDSAEAGPRRRSKHLKRVERRASGLLTAQSADRPPACDRPILSHGAGLVRVTRSRDAHINDLKAGEGVILRKHPERHGVADRPDRGTAAWGEDGNGLDGSATRPQRVHTPDRIHRENAGRETPPTEARARHLMSKSAVLAVRRAFDGENGGEEA
jgi:hypothetical protein